MKTIFAIVIVWFTVCFGLSLAAFVYYLSEFQLWPSLFYFSSSVAIGMGLNSIIDAFHTLGGRDDDE